MSAHEPAAAAAHENRRPEELSGARRPAMSMRDLLAACAAADAVSTPPRAPEAREDSEDGERDAA
ncbi:hypothetical protein M1P56_01385 [Streptomyces sp. HU2014]|uniref:hypothetical protein n=1 Tax=Streptomyces sp. HU2014 TaxID=2939414 RepID=UPI00200D846B|nr:hypothetical protein [Streptomyces sp. HU2014]UQI43129.1 hypothetical protein M1P56_01385 [Streptomyces sp. HU2014]